MEEGSASAPVFADERQQRIADLIAVRGRARIGELAQTLGVTEPTIRKDLSALEMRGVLKRTHGGAIALRPLTERELSDRQATNATGKAAIGRTCISLLEEGDSVFLDSGTTVGAIATAIAADPRAAPRNLVVLTNAINVATTIAGTPGIEHVLLGGELRGSSGSVVGALAVHNLQRFTVNVAFLGVSGFSELGISAASAAEAGVKSAVIERARRVIVAMERAKVGATDFARISGLDPIDAIVLDASTPEIDALCALHGIEVIQASSAE